MVDLEQFREAVAAFKVVATQAKQPDVIAEADRLLSIIDSAGKCPCGESACTESWEPGCGLGSSKEHAAVSEVTRQLIERDRRGRTKYGTSLDRTDLSISEWLQHMAEELLDGAGYALAAKRAVEQPWVVVDEAARLLAICQNAHDRLLRGDDDSELLAILEQAWNAHEALESP